MELRLTKLNNPDAEMLKQTVTVTRLTELGRTDILNKNELTCEWIIPESFGLFGASAKLILSKKDIAKMVAWALNGQ